jgi:hypothetical protein
VTKSAETAAFQKVEPRKIKVDLPTLKPETSDEQTADRPAKRARTAGAFGGFNSLLPAPKRTAAQNAPARGVSLKTSSEAAFSRQPVVHDDYQDAGPNGASNDVEGNASVNDISSKPETAAEPKIVGKATKFKPLSVQGGKKKKKPLPPVTGDGNASNGLPKGQPAIAGQQNPTVDDPPRPPAAKAKRSLFSVPQANEEEALELPSTGNYESIITQPSIDQNPVPVQQQQPPTAQQASNPDSLDSLAGSLNLTAAQRRQLFGRNSKGGEVNIAHFNMDAEYASNEQLRQAGEVVEHKAVKSIAPGKHSLQQLVNNARSQQDNLEDKWAEGRRERGEGSSKYGWSR